MLGAASSLGLRLCDGRSISVLSGAVLQREAGHPNSQGPEEANQTSDKQKGGGSTHIHSRKHIALASFPIASRGPEPEEIAKG